MRVVCVILNLQMEKKCTKCSRVLQVLEFRKDSTKKDGYYSSCNDCHRNRLGIIKRPEHFGQWHVEKTTGYLRKGDIRQHRMIAEKALGRKLSKTEHVHHINHDKTDNRIENLLVMQASFHHKIHTGKSKKGEIKVCVICGKKKYYCISNLKNISNSQYRCYSCYTSCHQKRQ